MVWLAMQRSSFSIVAPDEYNLTSLYSISQCVTLFVIVADVITLSSALHTLMVYQGLGNQS